MFRRLATDVLLVVALVSINQYHHWLVVGLAIGIAVYAVRDIAIQENKEADRG
jgi:hypothetical protein